MGSEVVIVPSLFLMIGFVFYTIANAFTRRQQLKSSTEFQSKLLERIGSVEELGRFSSSPGGRQLLSGLSSDAVGNQAHQRVLRAFQSGIVMVCLGGGIFLYLSSANLDLDSSQAFGFVGTVSAAVGLGLVLSGWISLRLSRRLGLIGDTHETTIPHEIARS